MIPTILLILAMLTAKIRPETKTPPILLTPSMYGPSSASFTSSRARDPNGLLQNLLEPPSIGTTCLSSTLPIAPYTPCLMQRGAKVLSYYQKFMPLILQVNRSLPAMEESCNCQSEQWHCGSVEGTPPNLILSLQNTTDEVTFVIIILVILI